MFFLLWRLVLRLKQLFQEFKNSGKTFKTAKAHLPMASRMPLTSLWQVVRRVAHRLAAVLAQPSQKCCYNHTLFHHPVVARKEVGLPSRIWHGLFIHLWTCLLHHLAMPGHRYICTSPDDHQSFWNGDAPTYPTAKGW